MEGPGLLLALAFPTGVDFLKVSRVALFASTLALGTNGGTVPKPCGRELTGLMGEAFTTDLAARCPPWSSDRDCAKDLARGWACKEGGLVWEPSLEGGALGNLRKGPKAPP